MNIHYLNYILVAWTKFRWYQMKQEQCTTEGWLGWRTGAQMWIFSGTHGGAGAKRPPARTPLWPPVMPPATWRGCRATPPPATGWRLLPAASTIPPTILICGMAWTASILMPRYICIYIYIISLNYFFILLFYFIVIKLVFVKIDK